ncbi:MAG: cell shape determination protein CcmA [Syntrophus sp. (in: bacteria)]|nr:cell shape determination protein CcmA [Syntrophus sp. (in: bacteria)]
MFNRKADRLKLVLGEGSKITGDIEALGTIIIDGTIVGNVIGEKAILGEKAYVKGNVSAGNIIMGGKIDGCLKGKERVEVRATGQVFGDIHTSRLSIVEGAIFHGKSFMIQSEWIEQEEKKPAAQPDDGKVVELFIKDKTG